MTTYVVTYDLGKEEDSSDYKALADALKKLKGHKYQLSAWLIDTTMTPKQVVDHLDKYLDPNDKLWVSELTKIRWHNRAFTGTNAWLDHHPPDR